MPFVFFTAWLIGVLVCLGFMFGFPDKLKFWDVAKPHTEHETKFIQSHLEKIKNYQLSLPAEGREVVLSPFTQAAYLVVIGGAVLIAFNLSFSLTAHAVHFFIDVPGSKFVVKPYAGQLTIFIVSLASIGLIQFFLYSKAINDRGKSESIIFEPAGQYLKDTDEFFSKAQKIREAVSRELSKFIRCRGLDLNKTYSLSALSKILCEEGIRQSKRVALASFVLILLIFVMRSFSFVSVTEDRFIYSRPFSFKIIQSEFNSSMCAEPFQPTHIRGVRKNVQMTIDDGFQFSVLDTQTEGLYNFIKSLEVSDVGHRC